MRRVLLLSALVALAAVSSPDSAAQDKKKDKDAAPRVIVSMPLSVSPGRPTRLTLRGLKLDTVTEVKLSAPSATAKLLGKGKKVPVPNQQDAKKVGDSEIEVEVNVPKDVSGTAELTVVGPDGASRPYRLRAHDGTQRVAEREPNDGFKQAQPVPVPSVVEGVVRQPQDVDVYRVEGRAGERLVFEVEAARFGSPLDAILTLHDAEGRVLGTADDAKGSHDPILAVKLPRNGLYYLSLIDAHDQGGPAFVYQLRVRRGK